MQIFRKSLLLTAALALTAFAACSNDDNENGGDGKETDPDYLALPPPTAPITTPTGATRPATTIWC